MSRHHWMVVAGLVCAVAVSCGGTTTAESCSKDTDCKGARLCSAGTCVDALAQGGGAGGSGGQGGSGGGQSAPGGGGSTGCVGSFSINQTVSVGSVLAGKCDKVPPTNCSDGTYLRFVDGSCLCAAQCTTEGLACDKAGISICRNTRNTQGTNHAKLCVQPAWNLCQLTSSSGGGGGSSSSGGGAGGAGGGSSCLEFGDSCTKGSVCCSNSCTGGTCD